MGRKAPVRAGRDRPRPEDQTATDPAGGGLFDAKHAGATRRGAMPFDAHADQADGPRRDLAPDRPHPARRRAPATVFGPEQG
jgi:hypothetical protein